MSNRRHTPLMLIVAVLLVPFIFPALVLPGPHFHAPPCEIEQLRIVRR